MSRRAKLIAGAALAAGIIILAYLTWSRISATAVVRRFVRDAGIPIEVKSASWDMRLSELFGGKIRQLRLEGYYKPLNQSFAVETPVSFHEKNNEWALTLEPTIRIGALPPVRGELNLWLSPKRQGSRLETEGAVVEFHLRETKPLELVIPKTDFRAAVKSWTIDGLIVWNPLEDDRAKAWSGDYAFQFRDLTLANEPTRQNLGLAALSVEGTVNWPAAPPFPIHTDLRAELSGITYTSPRQFIEEPRIDARAALDFDGEESGALKASVEEPFQAKLSASSTPTDVQGSIDTTLDLKAMLQERLAPWFESQFPVLRRAKAKGTLKVSARAKARREALEKSGPTAMVASGTLGVDLRSLELPSKDLFLDKFALELPLAFPKSPSWGELKVGQVELRSIKLKDLWLSVRASKDGLDATTEDSDGNDKPIRQNLWGGEVEVAKVYARADAELKPGQSPYRFSAFIKGGPFELEKIQKDLCIVPDRPLQGALSFTYPQILQGREALQLIGDTNLTIFNGTAHVGDIRLVTSGRFPELRFDAGWDDLDLQAIGAWSGFGDMRGSLEGRFENVQLELRSSGLFPRSYHLTIRGRERSGKPVRFYGRAINNVLGMLGTSKDTLPGYASRAIDLVAIYRNLMPIRVDYLGFQAKADQEWTELTTFDPKGSENHYMLFATQFKIPTFTIPLNSHGVYPVMMRTDAFHGWLRDRINYFTKTLASEKQGEKTDEHEQCTPLW